MSGIYIHIPFCKQACFYCDFHFSTSLKKKDDLISSLVKEIEIRKGELNNSIIETIYFGGGTPSVLSTKEIERVIDAVYKNHKVVENPEITLEANPDDLSKEKIIAKTAKLNEVKEVDSAKILYLPQINPSLVLIPKSSLNDIERKIFAIAKSEWKAINYIAKQTYTVKISNTELLDALSQFLFEMHQYNLDKEKTNILILISKSLGKSENGRYKSVLQLVANNTTHKNLSDVSKKMSDILPFSNENFVTGSMNFKRILKEFKHN